MAAESSGSCISCYLLNLLHPKPPGGNPTLGSTNLNPDHDKLHISTLRPKPYPWQRPGRIPTPRIYPLASGQSLLLTLDLDSVVLPACIPTLALVPPSEEFNPDPDCVDLPVCVPPPHSVPPQTPFLPQTASLPRPRPSFLFAVSVSIEGPITRGLFSGGLNGFVRQRSSSNEEPVIMGHEPTNDKRGAVLKGVRFMKGRTDEDYIQKGPSPNKEDLADVTLGEKGKIINQQKVFVLSLCMGIDDSINIRRTLSFIWTGNLFICRIYVNMNADITT